ncbi:hypothetical protein CTAM01_04984 [Colletotrichum tamarilloi]|uniref:Uncharacterized protein n=1 Tax=Colletotrichum tamarilloi TaxID=1209934 RepID=A0ABQ9RG03_9PEZI|nr:uncharacterized protein CTAM01_04984 [Colletotrichum tamarilloi]KAK1502995.1 hypothetical protein CTAM01_04984 [Colletotrichum tamarilloi]
MGVYSRRPALHRRHVCLVFGLISVISGPRGTAGRLPGPVPFHHFPPICTHCDLAVGCTTSSLDPYFLFLIFLQLFVFVRFHVALRYLGIAIGNVILQSCGFRSFTYQNPGSSVHNLKCAAWYTTVCSPYAHSCWWNPHLLQKPQMSCLSSYRNFKSPMPSVTPNSVMGN